METMANASPSLSLGRSVGQYRLLSELGRGGFGVVYEAEHLPSGVRVALKTLQANLGNPQGQRALQRFLMEVRAVRQIRHPNVVRYIDGGQLTADDGSVLAYYAMELLPGETLDTLVRRDGPMHAVEAANIIRQSAVALYTAHQMGIIHRDVKPGNIMLAPSGRAVVTDFGVCKILETQAVTTAGQVVGTARYLSPEQFAGQPVDARSDIFALGALMFFLITGEHLRLAKDLLVLSRAVAANEDHKRVKEATGIPAPLRKVMLKATAKDTAGRYADALQLAHALEEACLSREVRALPPPPVREVSRRSVAPRPTPPPLPDAVELDRTLAELFAPAKPPAGAPAAEPVLLDRPVPASPPRARTGRAEALRDNDSDTMPEHTAASLSPVGGFVVPAASAQMPEHSDLVVAPAARSQSVLVAAGLVVVVVSLGVAWVLAGMAH